MHSSDTEGTQFSLVHQLIRKYLLRGVKNIHNYFNIFIKASNKTLYV
jgi:hypothetical protein